ncbi:Ca2+-binding RTX toxin-like protein [Rhodobacter viridis]|uniref:Ca2+-binding RTX toxin-like protein n=1 Tax=Rhodobacter viridis TaxID=1054202 RepID=A0A318TYK9_9RHOB|nr:Hint domain-containing protein [Rhodobacter viridis]PYF07165.1 Ca2+-binding RTX toxin-like protein [Rhodobacter viridis]
MATYTIGGYAAASITTAGGSTFALDAGYESAAQAITITVTDNDQYFSGSATSQLDTNQTAVVTSASGAVLASGAVRLGTAYSFTTTAGTTAKIYDVYVGNTLVGYVSTSALTPGVVMTVTGSAATTATGQLYSGLASTGYASSAASSLVGGAGNDTIRAGAGNDTVTGNAGNDSIDGGAGNDRLSGNDGNDLILGGLGSDTLDGGAGDDTLAGGAGADSIIGGSGMDYADYSASSGAVSIDLTNWTASGGDAAGDTLTSVDGVIGSSYGDLLIGFDGASYSGADIYTNIFYGGGGNDTIDGRGGNDILYGGDDNDSVLGGTGDDTLYGDAGNDTLRGGDGADSLSGGTGNDVLAGGTGADTLTGGSGADIFAFDGTSGADRITDFDMTLVNGHTLDQLDVSGLYDAQGKPVNWDDAVIGTDANGNAVITFPTVTGGPVITLAGMTFSEISRSLLHAMGVPCFTAGTLIETPRGPVPVESLRPGDLVSSRDRGAVPVLWAGGRVLGPAELAAEPGLLPVAIRENALGRHGALLVSPQHAVLAETDQGERLVRARHLAELHDPRFRIARGKRRVSYHHILLERHGILTANGLACESLYPGPLALAALGPAARLSIAQAQPWLAGVVLGSQEAATVYGPLARPLALRRGLRLVDPRPSAGLRVA